MRTGRNTVSRWTLPVSSVVVPSIIAARQWLLGLICHRTKSGQPGRAQEAVDRQAIERGENEGMTVPSGQKSALSRDRKSRREHLAPKAGAC